MDVKEIAKAIDHTLLKPESRKEDIEALCQEALAYNFATVCVNPVWVPVAAKVLAGVDVGITTVIGFPLGASTTFTKVAETRDAIANGATEIDMVIALGALKSGDDLAVFQDIKAVVEAAQGQTVKVIIETALLTTEEKVLACKLAEEAGADFVKTSTGFNGGGATVADIQLMRESVHAQMGVKASGGIRNKQIAIALMEAGANRLGASAGIEIVTDGQSGADY